MKLKQGKKSDKYGHYYAEYKNYDEFDHYDYYDKFDDYDKFIRRFDDKMCRDFIEKAATTNVDIKASEKIENRKQRDRHIAVCKNVIKRINESTKENNHNVPSLTMKKHIDEVFELVGRLYEDSLLSKEQMERVNEIARAYPVS